MNMPTTSTAGAPATAPFQGSPAPFEGSPAPFEGSPAAAAFIARVQDFLAGELADLARVHGITHEHGPDRALLRQVWRRSHALGF